MSELEIFTCNQCGESKSPNYFAKQGGVYSEDDENICDACYEANGWGLRQIAENVFINMTPWHIMLREIFRVPLEVRKRRAKECGDIYIEDEDE